MNNNGDGARVINIIYPLEDSSLPTEESALQNFQDILSYFSERRSTIMVVAILVLSFLSMLFLSIAIYQDKKINETLSESLKKKNFTYVCDSNFPFITNFC